MGSTIKWVYIKNKLIVWKIKIRTLPIDPNYKDMVSKREELRDVKD